MMPTGTRQDADRTVLSVPEAATRLGVTPDAIRARLHRKTLDGEKVNGEWRVYFDSRDANRTSTRQDTDRNAAVDRQDSQQDATGTKQDADRQGDSPLILQLVAAKDETIETLRSEIDFLRRELDTRNDELERRDVLLREALGRIPQLPMGDSGGIRADPPTASPQAHHEEIAVNRDASTSQSAPVVASVKWWRRFLKA